MNTLYDIIGIPFGYLMSWIYRLVPNYAIAIIIFTLVTKLILFPISYKTQKNAARTKLLQPKLMKIQKSFSTNPQRQQEETQKLYQEEGINPMGSCFPMLIQMIILFGVIDVVYKPITHILHITKSVRTAAIEKASELAIKTGTINSGKNISSADLRNELHTIDALSQYPDEFKNLSENFSQVVSEFSSKFTVFGANLGKTPTLHPEVWTKEAVILCLIPFLAGIAQLLVSIYSMIYQKKTNPTQQQSGGGCMWVMMLGMPLWSIWLAFTLPAGVGYYWIWSSLFSFLVTLGLNAYFTPERTEAINEKEKEKARIYAEKHPERKTFMQRMMEQAAMEQGNMSEPTVSSSPESSKKSRSEQRKEDSEAIKEARRRMAKKYGDDFEDDSSANDETKK